LCFFLLKLFCIRSRAATKLAIHSVSERIRVMPFVFYCILSHQLTECKNVVSVNAITWCEVGRRRYQSVVGEM